jgi:hypothetical protein
MLVHIHKPPCVKTEIVMLFCPYCQRREAQLATSYEWYGPYARCLCCGAYGTEDGYRITSKHIGAHAAADAIRRAQQLGLVQR